jgi:WD40 repeat protein
MSDPAFKHMEELFHQVVPLSPTERAAFLDAACAGDPDLRAAIESLLRHDKADPFLTSPVAHEADRARENLPTLPRPRSPQATAAAPALPSVPGYELLRELGRGGMGVVYLARHVDLDRLVALKMLSPTFATTEDIARFSTEALALARLHHPNVVRIYDVGEHEGRPYYTMEYIDGPTLAATLDGRPQDITASARLIQTLALAVHAVHECGIIHRDLKPGNVLLASSAEHPAGPSESQVGQGPLDRAVPKITDFGLAKDQNSARRLTQTDVAMGTPCYMAPEQVRNRRGTVGPPTDVYALGSMLYELLTGRPPFDAGTPIEVLAQVLNQEPLSPSRLRPRLPGDLVTICLKCLEKSARQRYTTAWDLAEDLRRYLDGEPILARPVGVIGRAYRWCRHRPLVAGLIGLCAMLAVAFVVTTITYEIRLSKALNAKVAEADDERRQIIDLNVTIGLTDIEQGDTFTAVLRFSEALRLEQDKEAAQRHRIRIAAALRQSPRLIKKRTGEGRVLATHLGSAGGLIASARDDHTIKVCDARTGDQAGVDLKHDEAIAEAAFSPDGHSLAILNAKGKVQVWDCGTGNSRVLPQGDKGSVLHVALTGANTLLTQDADSSLRLWDLGTDGVITPKTLGDSACTSFVMSEDARHLFTVSADRKGRLWNLTSGQPAAPPLTLEPDVRPAAISRDGHRVAVIGPNGEVRVWDSAGNWLPGSVRPPQAVHHVAFAPSGEQVLVGGVGRTYQLWRLTTNEILNLSCHDGGTVTAAAFSADGRLVVIGTDKGACVWDAETGQSLTPPLRQCAPVAGATFDPEANEVILVGRNATVCVWELPRPAASEQTGPGEIPAEAGNADIGPHLRKLRLGAPVIHAAFSPDGRLLITETEDRTVRVWDAVRGEALTPPWRHTAPIRTVFFRGDGTEAVVIPEKGAPVIWQLRPDERPVGEIVALAQALSCARINTSQKCEPLEQNSP